MDCHGDHHGDYIGAREAAERAGYTYPHFIQLLNNGDVAGFKDDNGRWRVPVAKLVGYRRRRRLLPELEDEIIRRFTNGERQIDISGDMGIPSSTVSAAVTRGYTRQTYTNTEPQSVEIPMQVTGHHYVARRDHTYTTLRAGDRINVHYGGDEDELADKDEQRP